MDEVVKATGESPAWPAGLGPEPASAFTSPVASSTTTALTAFDDDAVAIRNALADQPAVADDAIHSQRAALDLAGGIDEFGDWLAPGIAGDGALRNQEAANRRALLDAGANIHAGQKDAVRVWKDGTQRHGADGLGD